jgi:hypothetical protein
MTETNSIPTSTPSEVRTLREAEATVRRLYRIDAFWDINKSLEFALLRTYAVPSIAALLDRTGETVGRPRKRYDDTVLILVEVLDNGLESERARRAFTRLGDMHGRFAIRNDDFLYVLSTFILCPIDWLELYGRRAMTEDECRDWFSFWCGFAMHMGLENIFPSLEAARMFRQNFEAGRFEMSKSSRKLAEASMKVVLADMHVPRALFPFGFSVVTALCEPPLVAALGFPEPSPRLRRWVGACMGLRRSLLRILPVPTKPTPPQTGRQTYPQGYEIEELGTFERLRPAKSLDSGSRFTHSDRADPNA